MRKSESSKFVNNMETRKKFLSVIIILFSCLYCQAQEKAVSMLEGNPIWIYYRVCFGGKDPFEKNLYTVFSVNGDTVVNGKRYLKLYRESYKYKGITVNEFVGDELFDDGLEALLREDGNRIYAEKAFFEERFWWSRYISFELLDDELVMYDFNEMSKGNDINLWHNDVKTVKRFVGYDMVYLEDGTSCPLYKYYNYDEDKDFTPASLEVIDHIGCRNMFYGLLNYFDEPEVIQIAGYDWMGSKLNVYIQNGKIVYKAPVEDYIELSWIDKLIATKIENVYIKQSLDESTQKNGIGGIYSIFGQHLSLPQKGINIINGNKIMVK